MPLVRHTTELHVPTHLHTVLLQGPGEQVSGKPCRFVDGAQLLDRFGVGGQRTTHLDGVGPRRPIDHQGVVTAGRTGDGPVVQLDVSSRHTGVDLHGLPLGSGFDHDLGDTRVETIPVGDRECRDLRRVGKRLVLGPPVVDKALVVEPGVVGVHVGHHTHTRVGHLGGQGIDVFRRQCGVPATHQVEVVDGTQVPRDGLGHDLGREGVLGTEHFQSGRAAEHLHVGGRQQLCVGLL